MTGILLDPFFVVAFKIEYDDRSQEVMVIKMKSIASKSINTFVGALTLGVILFAIAFIVLFSSGATQIEYSTYDVYVNESVSGLDEESQVEYNGVNVGTVRTIEIDKKNPRLVKLRLRIVSTTPITRSTVATIATANFIAGISLLALSDTTNDLTPLTARPGEPYPVIPTTPSIRTRLNATMTLLEKNFSSISSLVRTTFTPDDLETMKEAGYSLRVCMNILKANSQHISLI